MSLTGSVPQPASTFSSPCWAYRSCCAILWRNADPNQGNGLGVLLVPGFGFGDASLALTATWLRNRGCQPAGAQIGLNVGLHQRTR
ncbi:hypothetical protein C8D87_105269 [Lentzea atacamensis]|uniref:Uncharacterized protein n=1 Tax=Lentzea atacamensis TaxID=531938 RepID=A0ABX9E6D3_9PSEU|nr:hypothetical protein C8D87_105269 [Lentzea atacamensis]